MSLNKDTQELIEAIGDYTAGKLRGDLAEAADKLGARQSEQLDRIEANIDLLLGHVRGLTGRVNALEGNCARTHERDLEAVQTPRKRSKSRG